MNTEKQRLKAKMVARVRELKLSDPSLGLKALAKILNAEFNVDLWTITVRHYVHLAFTKEHMKKLAKENKLMEKWNTPSKKIDILNSDYAEQLDQYFNRKLTLAEFEERSKLR